MSRASHVREPSTSQVLGELAESPACEAHDALCLDEILLRFNRRGFGLLILLATLPAFLPLPAGAGAISGPLVAVLGMQMTLGMRRPWLPKRLRQRTIPRDRIVRFNARLRPWLLRLEHLIRPRLPTLVQHPLPQAISGLMLLALGILLALPIPLTNYPLGLVIFLFAVALIERDGLLLLLCWLAGGALLAILGLAGGSALAWATST